MSDHKATSTLPLQIRVVDSHAVDGSDLSFLEGAAGGGVTLPRGRRAAETGFKNTLLFGDCGRNLAVAEKTDEAEGDVIDGSPTIL